MWHRVAVPSHQVTHATKNLFGLLRLRLVAKTSLRNNFGEAI